MPPSAVSKKPPALQQTSSLQFQIRASLRTPHCPKTKALAFMVPMTPAFPVFFFNDTATTEIYTLSLHDALPISPPTAGAVNFCVTTGNNLGVVGLATGSGGWAVTITNNNLTTPLVTCAIFINTAVLSPAVTEKSPPP